MKRLLILLLLSATSLALRATHIVGGEIYYDCLGGDNYLITMKLYRDCLNGQAQYDDPAAIGVYTPAGVLVQTIYMPNPVITSISNTISVPCYVPAAGNVCEEEAIYTATAHIPGSATGYYLVYQRCCRNHSIVNLNNPGGQGITLLIRIPPTSEATCNSSPRYNQFPPIYLCNNIPVIFDHSAYDPDGDSLAYELCAPYDGASQGVPMPQPPDPPPYNFVVYNAPYNGGYPMSASPALAVNQNSGWLTGTPNMIGTWVVAVCCKEYRNGVLLSINKRDFQFNVLNCQPIPVTSNIIPNNVNCIGLTIPFNQNSTNASFYHWDFGVVPLQSDTSVAANPVYSYSNPGTYTVSLIANPGTICSDTDTIHINVNLPVQPTFTSPAPQCITGNSFNFTAAGSFMGTGTFTWNFGPSASPQTSSQQNPSNVTWSTWGVFPVTLTVNENGCTGTHTDSVRIYPIPQAGFTGGPFTGCSPLTVQFNNASITGGLPITYYWDFGDGNTSTSPSPSHTYTQPGTYDVMLIINSATICPVIDTFFVPGAITVYPLPTAGIISDSVSVSIFNPVIVFTDQSSSADSCLTLFGDGSSTDSCFSTMQHVYPTHGDFEVTQIVYNAYGCADTARIHVEVRPEFRYWMPNTFTPNNDGLNEYFMPSIMGVENYTFRIFDRWGHLIFETHNTKEGWDGTLNGNKCPIGVYVWSLVFDDLPTGSTQHYIGHVNLLR